MYNSSGVQFQIKHELVNFFKGCISPLSQTAFARLIAVHQTHNNTWRINNNDGKGFNFIEEYSESADWKLFSCSFKLALASPVIWKVNLFLNTERIKNVLPTLLLPYKAINSDLFEAWFSFNKLLSFILPIIFFNLALNIQFYTLIAKLNFLWMVLFYL